MDEDNLRSSFVLVQSLSIVIPVYNSAAILPNLIQRLASVLPDLATHYEVILVNDGSADKSWESVCQIANEYRWVRGINLMRNFGQHNALLCGIRDAQGEIIITMDDDLQHPPEEIHLLLQKLNDGFDVVYGTPQQEQHGLWRDLASQVTKIVLQSAMGAETARQISAFRVFRTQVRDAFTNYENPYVSIDVLLTWGTTRFAAVTVRHNSRLIGHSNYTFRKLVLHTINMITGFSTLPLQLASIIGFALTIFGVGIFLYVVGRYFLESGAPAGFPFLASIIAIFSGAQLLVLGIIGEYLARIHFRMMDRPTYTVLTSTASPKQLGIK